MRYLTFFLLAITMSFISCEAPSKKDKKNAEEETSTPSSSGSNYGVSYPAPIQEYANNYCSCYADAAKKAAEMIELRTDHEEKLSSGDISCDEKDILEKEIDAMWQAIEDMRRDAEFKFEEWDSQAIENKGDIIVYGRFLAQEKTCPQVFFNLEAGREVVTDYRYYDCDRYSGDSDASAPVEDAGSDGPAYDRAESKWGSDEAAAKAAPEVAAPEATYDYDYEDYYEYEGGAESDDYEYDWQ